MGCPKIKPANEAPVAWRRKTSTGPRPLPTRRTSASSWLSSSCSRGPSGSLSPATPWSTPHWSFQQFTSQFSRSSFCWFLLIKNGLSFSMCSRLPTGVTFYLCADALYLGVLAASLCMSFFPRGITRNSTNTSPKLQYFF